MTDGAGGAKGPVGGGTDAVTRDVGAVAAGLGLALAFGRGRGPGAGVRGERGVDDVTPRTYRARGPEDIWERRSGAFVPRTGYPARPGCDRAASSLR